MVYKIIGGKVLDSGGFGCVFFPSIKCQHSDSKVSKNIKYVSKVMIKKYALDEVKLLKTIKSELKTIPEYKKYFLLDNIILCHPRDFQTKDLAPFDKCSALLKHDITKKSINDRLSDLLIINMPYGGINLFDYITSDITYSQLIKLNRHMVDLFVNGLIPMNNKHVCHGDIKSSNILVLTSKDTILTRIVDWGLSIVHTNKAFYSDYKSNYNFNILFSVILFNDSFINEYNDLWLFYKPSKKEITDKISSFIHKKYDRGLDFMNILFKLLYKNKVIYSDGINIPTNLQEYKFVMPVIIEYIYDILVYFTENGVYNAQKYFTDVAIHNMDIWGFITYYGTLVLGYTKKTKLDVFEEIIFNNVQKIYFHAVEHSYKQINIKYIYDILNDMQTQLEIKSGLSSLYTDDNIKTKKREKKISSVMDTLSESLLHTIHPFFSYKTISSHTKKMKIKHNKLTRKK